MSEEMENEKFLHLPKTPTVDIEFRNLSFSVPQGGKESKLILKNVSGKFRSGHLTAILGPSGSGKTTLLNVLAGYKFQHENGRVLINGSKQTNEFKNMSRYILQENHIQPLLTVKESMVIAADLKLGSIIPQKHKLKIILEILKLLRLNAAQNARNDTLSGGEVKRLFIAFELINNPSVLFLDEPTTGLDDVAAYQCIDLLKQLAKSGRTIICSIHSPSARLFSRCDHTYFVSSGLCIYQGCGSMLVSYLSNLDIACPVQFNPADYIIELCSDHYEDLQDAMVESMKNGENIYDTGTFISIDQLQSNCTDNFAANRRHSEATTNWLQFKILILRMWLLQWRNKNYLLLKSTTATIMGCLIGLIYINLGQDATKIHYSYSFFYLCIVLFIYVPMMPLLLHVPTEIKCLKREFFNKWYNLKPFFFALTLAPLPDQLLFGLPFITTLYLLTSQPLEVGRVLGFYLICFLTASISEGYAIAVASLMNVTNSSFFGPFGLMPFVIVATLGAGENFSSIPLILRILMQSSYLRYSLEGLMLIMLSGRKLNCPETHDYCLFSNLDYYLKKMSMDHGIFWVDLLVLLMVMVIIRGFSYYCLKQRLSPNKFFQVVKYLTRIK